MRKAEYILLAGLAAFAASLAVGSIGMEYSSEYSFGPGFLPLNVGILLVLCVAFQAWRRTRQAVPAEEAPEGGPHISGLLMTLAIMLGGVAAMTFGSILVPVAAMIWLISWRVIQHPPVLSAFVSVATVAAIYVIFAIWLGLPVR